MTRYLDPRILEVYLCVLNICLAFIYPAQTIPCISAAFNFTRPFPIHGPAQSQLTVNRKTQNSPSQARM